ncbi:MAG: DUF192 domain-containing protein [Chloroflexi bacterium]|nr:DUF192 domain-containing protein [Chloroflexota bacterium]
MPSSKTLRPALVSLLALRHWTLLVPVATCVILLALLGAAILFNSSVNLRSDARDTVPSSDLGQASFTSPPEAAGQTPAPEEQPASTPQTSGEQAASAPQTATANGFSFRLEVADTDEARRQGLSGRASLAQDAAMLFVFPQEAYWSFWMKEVAFPLDLVYINGDGFIVSVHTMDPQLGVPESQLKRYASPQPAKYALEINGGLATALGLEPGVRVELK